MTRPKYLSTMYPKKKYIYFYSIIYFPTHTQSNVCRCVNTLLIVCAKKKNITL